MFFYVEAMNRGEIQREGDDASHGFFLCRGSLPAKRNEKKTIHLSLAQRMSLSVAVAELVESKVAALLDEKLAPLKADIRDLKLNHDWIIRHENAHEETKFELEDERKGLKRRLQSIEENIAELQGRFKKPRVDFIAVGPSSSSSSDSPPG